MINNISDILVYFNNTSNKITSELSIISHEKFRLLNQQASSTSLDDVFVTNEITIPPEKLKTICEDFYTKKNTLHNSFISSVDSQIEQKKFIDISNETLDIFSQFENIINNTIFLEKSLNFGNKFNKFMFNENIEAFGRLSSNYLNFDENEVDLEDILSISSQRLSNFDPVQIFKTDFLFRQIMFKTHDFLKIDINKKNLISSDKIVGQAIANVCMTNFTGIFPNCFNSKHTKTEVPNLLTIQSSTVIDMPLVNLFNFYYYDSGYNILKEKALDFDVTSFTNNSNSKITNRIADLKNYNFTSTNNFKLKILPWINFQNYRNYFIRDFAINEPKSNSFFKTNITTGESIRVGRSPVGNIITYNINNFINTYFYDSGIFGYEQDIPTLTIGMYELDRALDEVPTNALDLRQLETLLEQRIQYNISRNNSLLDSFIKDNQDSDQDNLVPYILEAGNLLNYDDLESIMYSLNSNFTFSRVNSSQSVKINCLFKLFRTESTDAKHEVLPKIDLNIVTKSSLKNLKGSQLINRVSTNKFHSLGRDSLGKLYKNYPDFGKKVSNDLSDIHNIIREELGFFPQKIEPENQFNQRKIFSFTDSNQSFKSLLSNVFFDNINESKSKISKILTFYRKQDSKLKDYLDKIIDKGGDNKIQLLYDNKDIFSLKNLKNSEFINDSFQTNDFAKSKNKNIKTTKEILYNEDLSLEDYTTLYSLDEIKDLLKNTFKRGILKNRSTLFRKIIKESKRVIEVLDYNPQTQEKDLLFEKLLCYSLSNNLENLETIKFILYSVLNENFETTTDTLYVEESSTNDVIINKYQKLNSLQIFDFEIVNENIFNNVNIQNLHSYSNININKASTTHSIKRTIVGSGINYDIVLKSEDRIPVESGFSNLRANRLDYNKFTNHCGELFHILPSGKVIHKNYGDTINSWYGLEKRNHYDIFIDEDKSGFVDNNLEKVLDKNTPYYEFTSLYFDPENADFEIVKNAISGDFYSNIDFENLLNTRASDLQTPLSLEDMKTKLKEEGNSFVSDLRLLIKNNIEKFKYFPYKDEKIILKNNYFQLSRKANTISNSIKSLVKEIISILKPEFFEINKVNSTAIKQFFLENEELLLGLQDILFVFCTLIKSNLDVYSEICSFDFLHNTISIGYKDNDNSQFPENIYFNLEHQKDLKDSSVSDLNYFLDNSTEFQFDSDRISTEVYQKDYIGEETNGIVNGKRKIMSKRFFEIQEIATSLMDTDIMEVLNYDIITSYVLNFEKNKISILDYRRRITDLRNQINDIIKLPDESSNFIDDFLKNVSNQNYLNYFIRETNNLKYYKEVFLNTIRTQERLTPNQSFRNVKFSHRLQEEKSKIKITKGALESFIEQNQDNLCEIIRIGITKEVLSLLSIDNILKIRLTPFSHKVPDIGFDSMTYYYSPKITRVMPYKIDFNESFKKNHVGFYDENQEYIEKYKVLSKPQAATELKTIYENLDRKKLTDEVSQFFSGNFLTFTTKIVDDMYSSNCIKDICEVNQKVFDEIKINDSKIGGYNPIYENIYQYFNSLPNDKFVSIFGIQKDLILDIQKGESGFFQGKDRNKVIDENLLAQDFILEYQRDVSHIDLSKKIPEPDFYDIFSIYIDKESLTIPEQDIEERVFGRTISETELNDFKSSLKESLTYILDVELL